MEAHLNRWTEGKGTDEGEKRRNGERRTARQSPPSSFPGYKANCCLPLSLRFLSLLSSLPASFCSVYC